MQILGIFLVILMLLYSYAVIFLPCILVIIISVIVIFLIKKRIVGEKQKKYCEVIIIICVIISAILTPLWFKYISAKPDDTYVKMKEINENQSLIGLSKEQVIKLLGERKQKQI